MEPAPEDDKKSFSVVVSAAAKENLRVIAAHYAVRQNDVVEALFATATPESVKEIIQPYLSAAANKSVRAIVKKAKELSPEERALLLKSLQDEAAKDAKSK